MLIQFILWIIYVACLFCKRVGFFLQIIVNYFIPVWSLDFSVSGAMETAQLPIPAQPGGQKSNLTWRFLQNINPELCPSYLKITKPTFKGWLLGSCTARSHSYWRPFSGPSRGGGQTSWVRFLTSRYLGNPFSNCVTLYFSKVQIFQTEYFYCYLL